MAASTANMSEDTMSNEQIDPVALQAFKDYGNALSIAKKYWPNGPADVQQAAAATVLIHMKQLRTTPQSPSPKPQNTAGQPAAPAKPAPAPSGFPTACPTCGSEVWDNREDIKKGKKGPAWRCKNKDCKDEKDFVTSEWSFKKGKNSNTAYAQAHAVRDEFDAAAVDFNNKMPAALEGEGDLPF